VPEGRVSGRLDAVGIAERGIARRDSAFTMVEIALCLAVIAFALVAVAGVLPTGFRINKDCNYEGLMAREAQYLLQLVNSGGHDADYLTNKFDYIKIKSMWQQNRTPKSLIVILTNSPGLSNWITPNTLLWGVLTNGQMIAGALQSRMHDGFGDGRFTNNVTARVKQILGSPFQGSRLEKDAAFTYQLRSGVVPLDSYSQDSIDYLAEGLSPEEQLNRSNFWASVKFRHRNYSQVLLTLQGPIYQKGHETFESTPVYHYGGPPMTFRIPRTRGTDLAGAF